MRGTERKRGGVGVGRGEAAEEDFVMDMSSHFNSLKLAKKVWWERRSRRRM